MERKKQRNKQKINKQRERIGSQKINEGERQSENES